MIIYAGTLAPLVWIYYGDVPTFIFSITVAGIIILSNLIEWKLGFWDSEAKRQMKTRMATTLRISKTKIMHFSIWYEIGLLVKQALPIWVGGIAGLALFLVKTESLWLTIFTLVTLGYIVFQRAFSRYHYLPWFALLSFGSGLGMHWAMQQEPLLGKNNWGNLFVDSRLEY